MVWSAVAADSVQRSVDVNGQSRTYLLFVPQRAAGKPLPAFIILHGGGSDAVKQERYSRFDEFAASHDIIAIYPQAVDKHWNDGRVIGQQSSANDVEFIRTMLAALASEKIIDPRRVYAAGISNGGFMALRLACTMPDGIAGVGVIAASQPADAACRSPRPMPVIFFHGTADKFVPFNGGPIAPWTGNRGSTLSNAATVAFWQKENGCGSATMREMPSNDPASGLHATVETYSCPSGRGLENVIIEGGGHTWPGAHQSAVVTMLLGPVTSDIDANEMMWSFFQSQIPKY